MRNILCKLDNYSSEFKLTFEGGSKNFYTCFGGVLTILTLLCLGLFIILKSDSMLNYRDTNVMFTNLEYTYSDDDVLSDVMDFNVAFGLTEFDGSSEMIEDPDYATIEAKYRSWGFDMDDPQNPKVTPIGLRLC